MFVLRAILFLTLAVSLRAAEFSCTVTNAKGGEPLAEAAVSLIPLDQPAPPVPADAKVEIVQQDQEFSVFLTVVQTGTHVMLPNRDNVQHHVYSLSRPRRFELPLYNPGQTESIVFEVEGQVTIGCNIHDWMISHVVVVPTPWFAKTDDQGAARISAPAGRYRLEIWHPRLGKPDTREVTLSDGSAAQASAPLTLKPDRRVRRATGGKTGGYR
ncbi:methylamine utilization protein [Oleiharenicola lentus]|uniref:Methylamine utilization protein n=1 Tax=Oleiharenicola lentus TaxID=2508720 RepID=A0A4Q1C9T5_9BACT|nr:methylamine utilization protein [Oleiharenicola lentus]RXK55754.1 methylamine utilization protein [Oleiharenicola lentus]